MSNYTEHPAAVALFWARISEDKRYGCWLWGKPHPMRYGKLHCKAAGVRAMPAHRFAWELLRGPIPDGHEIDHLCRVMACVNPDHLEPVTPSENVRRGWAYRRLAEPFRSGTFLLPNGQHLRDRYPDWDWPS